MMIWLFICSSLLSTPILYSFKVVPGKKDGTFKELTLGNMIYSRAECFSGPLATNKIVMECPPQTEITQIFSLGLIPSDSKSKDQCLFESGDKCNGFIKSEELKLAIKQKFGQNRIVVDRLIEKFIVGSAQSTCTDEAASLVVQVACT